MIRSFTVLPLCAALLLLTACEQLGIETPAQANEKREAEGKAIGGACRHAGRALEDCYQINPRAAKAAIYTGWRDMDAYMRENKLEVIEPEFEPKEHPTKPEYSTAEEKPAAAKDEKPAEKKPETAAEEKKKTEPAKGKPATSTKKPVAKNAA